MTGGRGRGIRGVALTAALSVLVSLGVVALAAPAQAVTDLALAGVASASQSQDDQDGSFPPGLAIDGDPGTRWASGNGPDEDVEFTAWWQVDLGAPATVDSVTLAWEAAYAARYEVQVATVDPAAGGTWTTVHTEAASDGGTDEIMLAAPVEARWVRVLMLERVAMTWDPARPHWYGYSLYTVSVQGTPAQPAAVFGRATTTVPAGESAVVPVVLSAPAATDVTVRVTSGGGSAIPGTDYTPVDQVLTFPAGTTALDVTLTSVDHGPLAPVTTVELTLSEPSAGLTLGGRTTSTVTLVPHGELPDVGHADVIEDFESGMPSGYFPWGVNASVTPALSVVEAPRDGAPTNHALQAVVTGPAAEGDWFGFTHDFATPADWSDYDGFAFWFYGTGSGGTLRYEVKSNGQLFERSVVDDAEGWRQVTAPFALLRLKGDPASDARFDPSAATGFAVTLTDLGAGTWLVDDVSLYHRLVIVEDAEGDVPIAAPGETVGIFTWGSAPDLVSLGVEARDRDGAPAGNHVLAGTYQIPSGGWGGYSQNLAAPQDWSSFAGIRLLWYASQDTRPASPTAGEMIKVELKDGGPDGEHSELWAASFRDTWSPDGSRWSLIEIPFSEFTLSGYQPGDAATRNGTLDLTSAWGYAITMAPGTATTVPWAIDDVGLYGSAAPPVTMTVGPVEDVYLVDPGATASIPVRVTTTDGAPLTEDVEVTYATTDGTAVAGTHYTGTSGTVTFPAGTASGAEQVVEVATTAATSDDARTLELTLTSDQAEASSARIVLNAVGAPYLDDTLPTAERVEDLLSRMTLAEKIGQMTQAERLGLQTPDQIADLGLGSVLSGGGSVPRDNTPAGWADMVDDFQRQALSTRLQIPLLYGVDAVHGHNNVVGATIFPHNTGLGATRDPALVREVNQATAVEVRGTGVPWTFAPCLCVTLDERWGRSYESLGEDPALVTALANAAVVGLQGDEPGDLSGPDRLLATAKHWVGDGGTRYEPSLAGSGYPIDQGVTHVDSLAELLEVHVAPYVPAVDAGVGSIMPSYSAVDIGGAGPVRMHENGALNTDLLKGDLGFDGFLISDWEGIDKLPGGTYADKAARAVNAGLDMAMAPYNFGAFITAVTAKVGDGTISEDRVDDAVRRILTQKFALGLFETPLADRTFAGELGSADHRAIARRAVAESQVLLANDGDLLPLAAGTKLYVAGSNADDLGNQMGGWTISWQGTSGNTSTTGTTILEGLEEVAPGSVVTYSEDASAPMTGADVGVVVVGEPPYAEGVGDVGNNGRSLELPAADRAAIDAVCGALPCVVLVVAGRTQLVTERMDQIDALVASWLPGSEGAGVADVLFGAEPFTGRLPVTWPASADQVPINVGDAEYDPLFPYGWGLRTDAARPRLVEVRDALPAGAARDAVTAVLDAAVWTGDAVSEDADARAQAVDLLANAAALLDGTGDVALVRADAVVSVLRDLAQAALEAGTAQGADPVAATADAEQALMQGRAGDAAELLAGVIGAVVEPVEFSDVQPGHPFYDAITWLAAEGITTGYPDGTFRGTASVNRDAMAAFLYRLATGERSAPGCTAAAFPDVPASHPFCGEIAWLKAQGIAGGYADGTFRPSAPVARDAMAAFVYRFVTGEDAAAKPATRPFVDVAVTHPFAGEIAWLKAEGLSAGWPDGTFRPGVSIERQAMAAFLYRLVNETDLMPAAPPTAPVSAV